MNNSLIEVLKNAKPLGYQIRAWTRGNKGVIDMISLDLYKNAPALLYRNIYVQAFWRSTRQYLLKLTATLLALVGWGFCRYAVGVELSVSSKKITI